MEQSSWFAKFIISPEGSFHRVWDIILVFLLTYTAIFVPYKIAFYDIDPFAVAVVDYGVDILFFTDVIVNFITSIEYPIRQTVVRDPKRIASSYLQGWFVLDLTVCIPFDLVFGMLDPMDANDVDNSAVENRKLIKLARLYRLIRIFRILKIFKMNSGIANYIESFQIGAGAIRMAKLIGFTLFLIHIFSCVWFYTSKADGFYAGTWVFNRGMLDMDPLE